MDRDHKLARYRHKDYSERVAFPVEIVGRDGVVRRYDFDASIRMYQRRLRHAGERYRDPELVRAEQGHCRARIEQLRRSYFETVGWTSPEGRPGPEADDPALAGEIAALLTRALRASGRLDVRFVRVAQDDAQVAAPPAGSAGSVSRAAEQASPSANLPDLWQVEVPERSLRLLLYVWQHPPLAPGAAGRAEAALRALGALRAGPSGGDAEQVVATARLEDVTLALTGVGDEVAPLASSVHDADDEPVSLPPTPWDEVRDAVRAGDVPAAFLRCRWLLEVQPFHREAYVAGAALALSLGRAGEAEDLAFVGSRYFPGEGLLHHYLGVARLRQGRRSDALASFAGALACQPVPPIARSAAALVALDEGRLLRALVVVAPGERGSDGRLAATVRGVVVQLLLLLVAAPAALAATALAAGNVGEVALLASAGVMTLAVVAAKRVWTALAEVRRAVFHEAPDRVLRRLSRG